MIWNKRRKDKKFNPLRALIKLFVWYLLPNYSAWVAAVFWWPRTFDLSSLMDQNLLEEMYPAIKGLQQWSKLMSLHHGVLPLGWYLAKRFGVHFKRWSYDCWHQILVGGPLNSGISWLQCSTNNYAYQVIPVLAAIWFCTFEKFFHKKLPFAVDLNSSIASVWLLILTFIVGPVMPWFQNEPWCYCMVKQHNKPNGMTVLQNFIIDRYDGLHQSFPAIETQLFSYGKRCGPRRSSSLLHHRLT